MRERAKKESSDLEPLSSDTVITSREATGQDKTLRSDNTETFNKRHYSSFPLLPLPPREYRTYGDKTQYGGVPTEDKMGTLHNAIIERKQQPEPSPSSGRTSSSGDKGTERRVAVPKQSAAVRFVPRTTHLESKKRRMQEAEAGAERSGTDVARDNEPLIGPRLPETPKLDMEDKSLNTTVSLIRNTLKKVTCHFFFLLDLNVMVPFSAVSQVDLFPFVRWNLLQTSNQWRKK